MDIYTRDPNRIIKRTSVGDVQAWPAPDGAVSVNLSIYAHVQNMATETAYMSHSLNINSADARDLARILIEAADHADAVRIVSEQEPA